MAIPQNHLVSIDPLISSSNMLSSVSQFLFCCSSVAIIRHSLTTPAPLMHHLLGMTMDIMVMFSEAGLRGIVETLNLQAFAALLSQAKGGRKKSSPGGDIKCVMVMR